MKKQYHAVMIMFAIVLALSISASAVTAAPSGKHEEGWKSIDLWAFIDNDRDGIPSAGDQYLHNISVCLSHKQSHWSHCGATDYGDNWWEPRFSGMFVGWVDANDEDLPPGLRLNSITCRNTGELAPGKLCITRLHKQEAQFQAVPGGLMNVYFGFVPEE